jgi:hypothetical protein
LCGPGQAGASNRDSAPPVAAGQEDVVSEKPAAESLGIDLASLRWRRPGGAVAGEPGTLEVAMARTAGGSTWVLLRVAGDSARRVLVYDELEWDCFLDGVRNGEFDVPG